MPFSKLLGFPFLGKGPGRLLGTCLKFWLPSESPWISRCISVDSRSRKSMSLIIDQQQKKFHTFSKFSFEEKMHLGLFRNTVIYLTYK